MRQFFYTSTIAAISLIAITAGNAPGAIVFEHVGGNDPATEGFSAADIADTATSSEVGPPANWKMATPLQTSATTGYGTYSQSSFPAFESALVGPTGWTLTVVAKLTAANRGYEAAIRIQDASGRLEMHMIDGTGALPAGLYYTNTIGIIDAGSKIGMVNPTSGFHTYQMIKNPNGAGTTDDEISFYVDGTLALTTLQSNLYGAGGGTASHFFGAATYVNDGTPVDQQYALVRLETGQNVVPEPMGVALLGLSGTILGIRRRSK